jgi:hypothetical protein
MGLLDNITHQQYYQGNDFGGYQFTSLEAIINQFMVVYVGDNKVIPKASRVDIAFHAQRALAELSFDTLKSVKAYEIELPPSLQMILPHDYVNYTKISSVDSAGIKHPLYPTKHTSNPFQILQEENGDYTFVSDAEEIINGTFDTDVTNSGSINAWVKSQFVGFANYTTHAVDGGKLGEIAVESSKLVFKHRSYLSTSGNVWSTNSFIVQPIDVSDKEYITLSADGQAVDTTISTTTQPGVLKVGITTILPPSNTNYISSGVLSTNSAYLPNIDNAMWDLADEDGNPSYLEWTVAGDNTTSKSLESIDVRNESIVYVIVLSRHDFTAETTTFVTTNNIDNISVTASNANSNLISPVTNGKNISTTWNSYKSHVPSENNNDDYEDDTYWPANGERYGLDPSHAQVNGSFFIDQRLGKIHFSSNISGKTVILDYISDSLGTDSEMQVHKFAEEAIYKSISHAILSTSSYGQSLVPRLTKEKFAAIRKAKLRLSNIKLEELTQILRGKSKQIKH